MQRPGLPLSQAAAATSTTTFSVTAEVVTTCGITATNMNFGNYSGVLLAATATLEATCSTGTPYTIGLNAGTGDRGDHRHAQDGGTSCRGGRILNSTTLSQDAAHSINWGDTIGTDSVPGTGNGAAQPLTVFGRIPASQFIQSGAYSDTPSQ